MNKSTTTQETLTKKEQLLLDEVNMLCTMIEGELATSTPDFIDKNINKLKNLKTYDKNAIIVVSLIKRLTNIKEELQKKEIVKLYTQPPKKSGKIKQSTIDKIKKDINS